MAHKGRIAVVSPFLDRKHGTERCIVEQIERLSSDYEIHVYSSSVEDLEPSTFIWHRIPSLPSPHLISYIWFFLLNQIVRLRDRKIKGLTFDLVFCPGINCLDADLIAVHMVFAEFYRVARPDIRLSRNPLSSWPRLIHRILLYKLFVFLENWVYRSKKVSLTAVSKKVANDLARFYSRHDVTVLYSGLNSDNFSVDARLSLREHARKELQIAADGFLLLLVGNDWKKKGLPCALEALAQLSNLPVRLTVIGADDPKPFGIIARQLGVADRIQFLPVRPDVMSYYAAADACIAPSIEDGFALPPAEAMLCGVPAIVSRQAGVSEIVTDETDGLILEDPRDSQALAHSIRRVYHDSELRSRLSSNAATTAARYSWERNAAGLKAVIESLLKRPHQKEHKALART